MRRHSLAGWLRPHKGIAVVVDVCDYVSYRKNNSTIVPVARRWWWWWLVQPHQHAGERTKREKKNYAGGVAKAFCVQAGGSDGDGIMGHTMEVVCRSDGGCVHVFDGCCGGGGGGDLVRWHWWRATRPTEQKNESDYIANDVNHQPSRPIPPFVCRRAQARSFTNSIQACFRHLNPTKLPPPFTLRPDPGLRASQCKT